MSENFDSEPETPIVGKATFGSFVYEQAPIEITEFPPIVIDDGSGLRIKISCRATAPLANFSYTMPQQATGPTLKITKNTSRCHG